ncbi:hypothetical protein [Rhodovulum sp. MB263]|uniref:putative PDDEXK endonuclease n=1 Tax=Rhodovulum sp. (strain MB263) TaxID=308754 RepID=UPI0009B7804E|nr:hypothetical protein [Rhodovulum sp. MB263]ARC90374.1 hypothetical protein B5V46_18105 [Rhodovulum sp. MB263]
MKDRSAIGRRNRAKGAELEREVAAALFDLTGIAFRRNLRQCQESGWSDLVTDDPAWPFSIECKRRSAGTGCADDWRAQAAASARKAGQLPVVVYRFDRRPIRCALPLGAIRAAFGDRGAAPPEEWVECSLDGLAYLAREIMAGPGAAGIEGAAP